MDKPVTKDFVWDCFRFSLKCSELYRRNYLTEIVTEEKSKVYAAFYKSAFVIQFDETTFANGRYILNIMGQPLNGSISRHYLIDTIELERCNSANIYIYI